MIRGVHYLIAQELHQQKYWPMWHGKATDALSALYTGSIIKDDFDSEVTVTVKDVEFKFLLQNSANCNKAGIYYVSMHKLLSLATIMLCAQNNSNSTNSSRLYEVVIPLRVYAGLCGYDVIKDGVGTKEDKAKEENVLRDVRKKVHRDLDMLFALEIKWSEKIKGKSENFLNLHLISEGGIKRGNIIIEFSQKFGDYLMRLPLTQYPLALLKIDERNKNAYSIGLKMAEQANMYNNIIKKTDSLLKVSTLLNYTNLPNRDGSSVKKVGWRERIKKPFENSLNALIKCGLLQDWEYCHSKGIPLIDEEADFKTFEEWADILVHFNLKDLPDHTDLMQPKN